MVAVPVEVSAPEAFLNRERSWLEFNERVLAQARDTRLPLLERIKFLAIASSNLDEFFMVQVADVWRRLESGVVQLGPDGMSASETLAMIQARVNCLHAEQLACLRDGLLPALGRQRIRVIPHAELAAAERAWTRTYFEQNIFPVITPLALGPTQPFPHISNLSLNLLVTLHDQDVGFVYARVKIPDALPRLVRVEAEPKRGNELVFTWMEEIVAANLQRLFPGVSVQGSYVFRVVRDADLEFRTEASPDLLTSIQESLRQRHFGGVVQLDLDPRTPEHIRQILMSNMDLDERDVYEVDGPLGLSRLTELYRLDRPDLKDPPLLPRVPAVIRGADDLFAAIRQQDILLHHPYESFVPVVDFVRAAATDPSVVAIKQTLYRVGLDSPIVRALMTARENGKQVAVLVELRARFEEEHNIEWARALDRAGVHVVYGVLGLKTHAKLALVVRREQGVLRRYVHLGTGNYNVTTGRLYTDFSFFTCDDDVGADATEFFNALTGFVRQQHYRVFTTSPGGLRQKILELIRREIAEHRKTGRGRLIFKMNALTDAEVIRQLYLASAAGVQVDLIVRGMCTLRPGVPGLSDNIRVLSIIGRFLEHARAYYFHNGGDEELYLGSADLRPRNLDRRVEVIFPVRDEGILRRIRDDILGTELRDTAGAALLLPGGDYARRTPEDGEAAVDAQRQFLLGTAGIDESD